jgi:phospholipid/cholesterol/gamma-HCH transport system ATP-binding protein
MFDVHLLNWFSLIMIQKPIIQVKNLVARYGDEIILDNISFDVFKGEIIGVIGTSGCGKSTLLRHLIGLDAPYSGKIYFDDIDIAACDETMLQSIFRDMGVLFQGGALFGSMTLAENIALPMFEYTELSKDIVAKLVHMKLCKFDLTAYPGHLPSQLSGGMKKRAGLARAMALNPRFLFLDEPTSGLDPVIGTEINALIRDISQSAGITIVLVTHDIRTIFDITDRVLMLDKDTKKIIAEGNPALIAKQSQHPMVRRFLTDGND